MNSAQAKRLSIIDFLDAQNIRPERIVRDEYWYKSPYREENTASFTVNSRKNSWIDFGSGEGGNLLDLAIRIFNDKNISSVLNKIEQLSFSFGQQQNSSKAGKHKKNFSEINQPSVQKFKVSNLNNCALLDYLASRKVDGAIAKIYCREVYYQVNGKNYFAIGFKNNSEGYELRNKYFKSCIAQKDFTLFDNSKRVLSVFEGFFDFLSYLTISGELEKQSCYLILNSLSLVEKSLTVIKEYQHVNLYLDHDKQGRKYTAYLLSKIKSCNDRSFIYNGFKDLNQWLVETDQPKDFFHKQYLSI